MSAPWEKYQTESDGPWNNYAEGGGPWSSYADEIIAPSPVKTTEKSFLGGVADAAGKRLSKTGDILSNMTGEEGGVYGFFKNAPAKAIQVAGQGAGFINDVVGQGISAGYRNLVPESAQKAISEGVGGMMANPAVKLAIQGISEGYGERGRGNLERRRGAHGRTTGRRSSRRNGEGHRPEGHRKGHQADCRGEGDRRGNQTVLRQGHRGRENHRPQQAEPLLDERRRGDRSGSTPEIVKPVLRGRGPDEKNHLPSIR